MHDTTLQNIKILNTKTIKKKTFIFIYFIRKLLSKIFSRPLIR